MRKLDDNAKGIILGMLLGALGWMVILSGGHYVLFTMHR